jgi:hypothetical protein
MFLKVYESILVGRIETIPSFGGSGPFIWAFFFRAFVYLHVIEPSGT